MSNARYEDVPAAAAESELDPHFAELTAGRLLPSSYMPPVMPGTRGRSLRLVAAVLVGVFGFATFCGVCLTYGPGY